MPITIIGAGISGLILGRCLLQRGIPAVLLEKSTKTTFSKRNDYGITLHRKTYQPLLKVLGLDEGAFRQRVAVDAAAGRVNGEGDLRVNRNQFERLLVEELDVRWEREVEVESVEEVQAESGIVVGADGPHSVVRRAVAPAAEFEILPFAVYNGKRRIGGEEFEREVSGRFGGEMVVEQRVGDVLFQVSVSERTAEEVSVSYTFSRPARGGEDPLFRPQREKSEAKAIPAALFDEVDGLRDRLEAPLAFIFDSAKMQNDRMLNWLMRTVELDGPKLRDAAEVGVEKQEHIVPILTLCRSVSS